MEAPDESVTQSSTPMHADALDGADEHAEQAGGNDVRAAPTSQAETAASEAPSDAVLPQADGPRPSAEDPIAAAAAMAAAAAAAAVAAAAAEYQQPKAAAHEATAVEQPEAQHAAPEPEGAPPVTPEAPAVEVPLPAEEPPASTPPRAPAPAEAAHDFAPEAEGSSAKMDRPAMFEIGGYKPGVAGDSSAQRGSETGGVQPHPPPGERPPGARATSTGGSRPPSRANSRLGTPAGPTSRFDSVFDFTNERLVDHTWKKSSSEVDRDRNTQSAPSGLYNSHRRDPRPVWIAELDTPSRWKAKLPKERLEEASMRLYSRPTTAQSSRPPERPRTGRLVYTFKDGRFHAELREPIVLPVTQYIAKLQVQYNRSLAEHHALKKELFTKYAPKLSPKEMSLIGLDKELPVKTEEAYLSEAEEAIRLAEEAEEKRKEVVRAQRAEAAQRALQLKQQRETKNAQRTQDFMEKHAAWLKTEAEKREREREEQRIAMASDKAKLRQFAKEYAEKRARAAQLQQEAAEQRRLARIEEDKKRQEEAEKREADRKAAMREWRVADLERRKQMEEAAAARGDTEFAKSIAKWEESVRQRQRDDEERRRMQVLKDKHDILAQTAAYKAQIEAKKKAREDELAAAISIRLQEDAAREKKRQDREAAIREAQRQFLIDEKKRRLAMMEKVKEAASHESATHAMQHRPISAK